jgi:uncharacterized damage-inducible protein DinB
MEGYHVMDDDHRLNNPTGPELATHLRAARAGLLKQIEGLTDAQLRQRPADGDWSIIEVLAHLVDVDAHWLVQAEAIRGDATHLFAHVDDERWKREHPEIRHIPYPELAERLAASHRAVVETLAALTPADLARPGRHPRSIPYTVRDVFRRYPAHDQNHTIQIEAIRAQL